MKRSIPAIAAALTIFAVADPAHADLAIAPFDRTAIGLPSNPTLLAALPDGDVAAFGRFTQSDHHYVDGLARYDEALRTRESAATAGVVGDVIAASYGHDGNLYLCRPGLTPPAGGRLVRVSLGGVVDPSWPKSPHTPLCFDVETIGDRVYVAGPYGVVAYSVDGSDAEFELSGEDFRDLARGPEGTLYVASQTNLLRVDAATGEEITRRSFAPDVPTRLRYDGDGGHVYVMAVDEDIFFNRYEATVVRLTSDLSTSVVLPVETDTPRHVEALGSTVVVGYETSAGYRLERFDANGSRIAREHFAIDYLAEMIATSDDRLVGIAGYPEARVIELMADGSFRYGEALRSPPLLLDASVGAQGTVSVAGGLSTVSGMPSLGVLRADPVIDAVSSTEIPGPGSLRGVATASVSDGSAFVVYLYSTPDSAQVEARLLRLDANGRVDASFAAWPGAYVGKVIASSLPGPSFPIEAQPRYSLALDEARGHLYLSSASAPIAPCGATTSGYLMRVAIDGPCRFDATWQPGYGSRIREILLAHGTLYVSGDASLSAVMKIDPVTGAYSSLVPYIEGYAPSIAADSDSLYVGDDGEGPDLARYSVAGMRMDAWSSADLDGNVEIAVTNGFVFFAKRRDSVSEVHEVRAASRLSGTVSPDDRLLFDRTVHDLERTAEGAIVAVGRFGRVSDPTRGDDVPVSGLAVLDRAERILTSDGFEE